MNIQKFKQLVIENSEILDIEISASFPIILSLNDHDISDMYIKCKTEFSSLNFCDKYNEGYKFNFSKREIIIISFCSGIPGVLSFMMFYLKELKDRDSKFNIAEYINKYGVIKNTCIKKLQKIQIT
ncbi:MAG: hypothetical protein RBT49_10660 [Bacteroidales bacterium]|jgi:hypothetical protein|nr:hypothetical protein [Bacteroidales bacterium]